MNRIYKSIFNRALGTFVAVPEFTSAKGKPAKSCVSTVGGITSGMFKTVLSTIAIIVWTALFSNQASADVLNCTWSTGTGTSQPAADYGRHYVACGAGTKAQNQSVAIGPFAQADSEQSIALGADTRANGQSSIAIGGDDLDRVASTRVVPGVTGTGSNATYNNSAAAIAYRRLTGDYLVNFEQAGQGVGRRYYPTTSGAGGVSVGVSAHTADLATAFGTRATASGIASLALGVGSKVTYENAVAIGAGSVADSRSAGTKETTATIPTLNGLPLTYTFSGGTDTEDGDIVSFGTPGYERQLKNVASGKISANSTDAVNGSQLYGVATKIQTQLTHYYSVKSGDQTANSNYNNDGATGGDAIAAGPRAKATNKNAVALGSDTTASGEESLAVGNNVTADSKGATAVGNNSKATAEGAQAFGQSSEATAKNAAAIGRLAIASGTRAAAFGVGNTASGESSLSVGDQSVASGTKTIAIGVGANASYSSINKTDTAALAKASGAIAIGEGATSSHDQAISFGYKTKASNDRSLAFGSSAQAAGQSSISIGSSAATTDIGGLAVGNQASSKGDSSTALGAKTKADEAGAVAVGNASQAAKHSAVAIGNSSNAGIQSSIAIGRSATTTGTGEGAIAIGRNANADGQGSTSMGINARSSGQSIAIGTNANNTGGTAQPIGASTVTIGNNANAQSARSIAFGNDAVAGLASAGGQVTAALAIGSASKAEGQGSVVIGDSATNIRATGNNSHPAADQVVSIGVSSNVNSLGGIAVGSTAKTTGVYGAAIGIGTVNQTDFGVALGALSTTDKTITVNRLGYLGDQYNDIAVTKANAAGVSIGGTILNTQGSGPGQTAVRPSGVSDGQIIRRQLHNLAAGTADTDAVNVAQLKAVSAKTDRTPLTTTTDGKVNVPTNDAANKLATAADIANAINAAGFKLTVAATGEGTLDGAAGNELINAGDTVTVEADKNIKVKQANGKVTISTEDNVEFTSVKTGDSTLNGDGLTITGGPSVTKTNGINAGNKQIKNVANGTAGTDAVNVSQLNAVKTTAESKLGNFTVGADAAGNATGITVNKDNNRFDVVGVDKITTSVVGNKINVDLTQAAKTELQKGVDADTAVKTKGLTFNGDNSSTTGVKKLGEAVAITGDSNITTVATNAGVQVKLNPNVNVSSVTAGNTKIANNGITIANTDPSKTVSLTSTGLNNGNQTITHVAEGVNGTDAVNLNQLNAKTATTPLTNNATTGLVNIPSGPEADKLAKAGDIAKAINNAGFVLTTTASAGELGATANHLIKTGETVTVDAGENIKVSQANGKVTISTKDDVSFNKVTGKTVVVGDSTNNTTLTSTANGLNVGGDKITGVANGNIAAGSTDAVNGGQLHDVKTTAESKLGDFTVGADAAGAAAGIMVNNGNNRFDVVGATDGKIDTTVNGRTITVGLNSDAKNSLAKADSALQSIKVQANGGDVKELTKADNVLNIAQGNNIDVSKDGSNVKVALKDNIAVTGVTAGASKLDTNGLVITGGPSVKKDGIDAGDKVISNVAAGKTAKDAVNVSQLNPLATALGSTVAADGTVNAPSLVVTKADGTQYTGAPTVQGALDNIGTEIKKPIGFAGNTGNFDRTLGTTTTIKGSLATTTTASSGNIRTEANNGTIEIKFADAPTFAGKVTAQGGLDVNNNKITGVANGKADSDAVNYSQLKAVEDAVKVAQSGAWELQSNGAKVSEVGAGSKVDFVNGTGTTASVTKDGNNTSKVTFNVATTTLASGTDGKVAAGDTGNKFATAQTVADAINAAGFTLTTAATTNGEVSGSANELINAGDKVTVEADKNIKVVQANGKVTISTKDDVSFSNVNATTVKAGDSTLNGDGLSITDGPSVTKTNGINAGNKQIKDVADGTVAANSKDAVNGGQLHDVKTTAESKLGNFTVGADAAGNATGITVNKDNNRFDVVGVDKITTSVAGNKINVDLTQAAKTELQKGVDADTAVKTKGLTFNGDNSSTTGVKKLGEAVAITGDSNITTVATNAGVQVKLNPNVNVTSVTTGNSKLDTNGLTITGGPSVTNAGIKAGNQVIADVAKGKADTDAVNVSQLKPLATALGSTVAADGTVNAPSLVVTKADGTQYTGAPTVQGALDNIGTEIKKPIGFAGNTGNFDRTLGTTTTIKGSLATTTAASSGNIRTEANNGTIEIKFADAPTFAGKVTAQGGLDVNNQKISNVAEGTANTDAVNVKQLKDEIDRVNTAAGNSGWEIQGNGTKADDVRNGDKVNFVNGENTKAAVVHTGGTTTVSYSVNGTTLSTADGKVSVPTSATDIATAKSVAEAINAAGFTLTTAATTNGEVSGSANELINAGDKVTVEADKNIKVVQANGKVTISTKDDVSFSNVNATTVKAGDSTLNGDGLSITDGPSVTKTNGINAGNKQIKDVADGTVAANSKDAVNGGQLHDVKTTAESKLGNFTVGADAAGNATGITVNKDNNRFDVVGVDKITTSVAGNKINVDLTQAAKTELQKGVDADTAVKTKGLTFNGDNSSTTGVKKLGEAVAITGDSNITTVATNAGVQVKLNPNVNVTSVTTGNSKLDTNGLTITGGPSVTNAGIKAGNQVIADVAKGKADTDAVNVSQLKPLATALGSTVAADGTVNAPSLVVTKADGTQYTGAPTVQGALDNIGTEIKKPIGFAGNTGNFDRTLGTTTTIKGSLATTTAASSGNIRTEANNGTIEIKFADAPTFAGKVTAQGGLDVNNQKITGVANGTANTDAVNYSQLKAVEDAVKVAQGNAWELQGNGAKVSEVGAGSKVDFVNGTGTTASVTKDGNNTSKVTFNVATTTLTSAADGKVAAGDAGNKFATAQTVADAINAAGFTLASANGGTANATTAQIKAGNKVTIDAGKNLTATQTGSVVTLATKDSVEFTSVKAGDSTLTSNGLTINGGPSVTKTGINSGGKKITDVADGTVTANSKDAVNGGQLHNVKTIADAKLGAFTVGAGAAAGITVNNGNNRFDVVGVDKITTSVAGNKINVDLTQAAKADLQKGVDAKTATDKGINFGNGTTSANYALGDTLNVKGDKNISSTTLPGKGGIQLGLADTIAVGTKAPVTINGTAGTVTGLTNKAWNPNSITSGRAATEDQLKALNDTVDGINSYSGWKLTTSNSTNPTLEDIGQGETVTVDSGENIAITQAGNKITVATKKDVTFTNVNATTVKAGGSTLNNNGLTISGGPSVTKGGIDAANTKIGNVNNGTVSSTSKDAVNGSQLFAQGEGVKNIIGGTTVYNSATGTYTNPNIGGTGKGNINDAIQSVNDTANKGWTLTAQGANGGKVAPGETVDLRNTDGNIKVSKTAATDTVSFDLAKDLKVDSVKAGNTTVNNDGVSVAGGPSLKADGIDAANKKITNVADGTIAAGSKEAVNGGQLHTLETKINDVSKNAKTTTVKAGHNVTVSSKVTGNNTEYTVNAEKTTVSGSGDVVVTAGAPDATGVTNYTADLSADAKAKLAKADNSVQNVVSADPNLTASKDAATGVVTLDFSDTPTFSAVTAGKTTVGNVVTDGATNKISGLEKGEVSATSKEAVNGSQLFAQGEGVKDIIGGTTVYNPATGTYTNPNIGGTGKGNINDAIQSIHSVANAGWNLTAQGANSSNVAPNATVDLRNNDGNIVVGKSAANNTVNFDLSKDLNVDSVKANTFKAGNTTVNNDGVMIINPLNPANNVSLTSNGLNNGGHVISNIAAGKADNDAVNVSQLKGTATALGGGAGINPDGSFKAPTYTTVKTDGTTVSANNVGDALTHLNNEVVKPLTFAADNGANVERKLGSTLNINGDNRNIRTVTTPEGVKVELNDVLNVNGVNASWVSVNNGPSMTHKGIEMNNLPITGMASGLPTYTTPSGEVKTMTTSQIAQAIQDKLLDESVLKNAVNVGDLTEQAQNVLNVSKIIYGEDGDGNPYVRADGTMSSAGRAALRTYNVDDSGTVENNGIFTAIRNMNEQGIKFFHTNDGVTKGDKQSHSEEDSNANAAYSTAIGYQALVEKDAAGGLAIGAGAKVSRPQSIALGAGSEAIEGHIAQGTPENAYTYGAQNDGQVAAKPTAKTAVLSVGKAGQERQVQHVAAGVVSATSTDAVNGSQLYYTNKAVESNTRAINQVRGDLHKADRQLRAGVAGAYAAASLGQVYIPGKTQVSLGTGHYRGESAVAVGVSRISDNGKVQLRVLGSSNTRGDVGAGASVSYLW